MKALDGCHLIFCHATTNQKHAGVTEGGWDSPRNCARTLGERDGNNESPAEGGKDDDDKYGKDGNIPGNDDEYAIGVNGIGEPLDERNDQCRPHSSVPCKSVAERALTLRASYSQWAVLRV